MGLSRKDGIARSNCRPADGPALAGDLPSPIGVHHDPADLPIGMAFADGSIEGRRGRQVVLWRLVIGKAELPGRFVLDGRVFVLVNQWLMAHGRGDVTT